MKRWLPIAGVAVAVLLVGRDFFAATTFLGDDYIFRAFARLEPRPWLALVADKHGGEYYRPLPMLLWWGLERLAGGRVWVFALLGFLLHGVCALLVARVGRGLGYPGRSGFWAGLLFFVSPAQREAALWFSASTDLLALAFMLGSLLCVFSDRRWLRAVSAGLAAAAFLCKESALVLPLLLAAGLWLRARSSPDRPASRRGCRRAVLPHLGLALAYLAARSAILRGLGGAADPAAPWWGRGVQILAGLLHAATAYAPLPEWAAWVGGSIILVWAAVTSRRQGVWAGFALVWVLVLLVPLPLAGWVVGARYFYAPAVGLFLLLALALEAKARLVPLFAVLGFLVLGFFSGRERASQVRLYRAALAAAQAAVTDGVGKGHRFFLVRGGVKDLDLAVKLSAAAPPALRSAVVIPDVPASFVWLPPEQSERVRFLLAEPPLPPAGAYRFGGEVLVGLARREEAPALDTVLLRMPDLRIIRLVRGTGAYSWQDQTGDYARQDQ